MTEEQQRLARASALGGALAGLGADVTAVAVLALAVPAVRSGALDGVQLAVVTLVTLAAFEAVAALPAAWQGAGAMRESARRLFELVDQPPAVPEPAVPAPGVVAPPRVLETRELRFAYPGESRLALDGVSLRLEPGRRVAVVGPSGSGKSTLVHLLLRFWDVPPGSLLLDGGDARAWPSDRVRASLAFAAQRAHLFTGTLRENLALAAPRAGDPELLAVLDAVRLGEPRGAAAAGARHLDRRAGPPALGRRAAAPRPRPRAPAETPPSCSSTSRRPTSTRSPSAR